MSNAATITGPPSPAPLASEVGLEAKGITKSYRRGMWPRRRDLVVLRGADLLVGAGEVVGLIRENGSGKSNSAGRGIRTRPHLIAVHHPPFLV